MLRNKLRKVPGLSILWAQIRLIGGRNLRFESDYGENSGAGSSLEITQHIVKALPETLREYRVMKLLDVPCGDFLWMSKVDLTGIQYTGGDIIKKIEELQRQHGSSSKRFQTIDLVTDRLPPADMILVRDCLVHFSNELAIQALRNIRGSGITYLLTTTFPSQPRNTDIVTGQHRQINLCADPFNFPPPLKLINEGGLETPDKSLGIWKIADLPSFGSA